MRGGRKRRMTKKVLMDCDVGVDDAFALILAFHSRELEVKAVTGVNGNVPVALANYLREARASFAERLANAVWHLPGLEIRGVNFNQPH